MTVPVSFFLLVVLFSIARTVPTRNESLNGLRCPLCYAKRPETCKEEVIDCRGLENQCFTKEDGKPHATQSDTGSTVTYEITQKGCATESFCANASQVGHFTFDVKHTIFVGPNVQCRAASHEARPPESEEQGSAKSGTKITLESTRLWLQAFAGLLIATSFYHCLF